MLNSSQFLCPPLAPVSEVERIEVLDVLRGFALFGVLLSNLETTTGQAITLTAEQAAALPSAAVDFWAVALIRFFVNGKFITLFTVLFGIGFSVQLERALARGGDFVAVYRRRLGVLLLFGLLHICLWWGDILHFYAVVGFVLLGVHQVFSDSRRGNRFLVWLASLLVVVPYATLAALQAAAPAAAGAGEGVAESSGRAALLADRLRALTEGTLADIVGENFAIYTDFYDWQRAVAMGLFILGYFIFGLLLGRLGALQRVDEHRVFLRRLLWAGVAAGLLGGGGIMLAMKFRSDLVGTWWIVPAVAGVWVGVAAMSGAYLAAIALLMQRPRWERVLLWLAPVGRMALSNYLMHSVLYLLIFDRFQLGPVRLGLGWLGHVGATACIGLAVVLFGLQMLTSRWWLRHFRFGPAEWLWRSLTYGELQPMRRLPAGPSSQIYR